ncbi:hypothetical protein LZ198_21990 [Myxococcus sp. K15C18031901]|uniref:ELWxxDGT repeat protein n=1 Tax=Myxococcus dinghuensis TaxID=2906761 RepID=UPI0020A80639|nr:ELWxxDGT repeat protein [Myxococcus dinghuensis]MCP3101550.1 hypothetical protein [Myxococcus dinghuensis]
MAWRGGWVMSLWVMGAGCGGTLPEGVTDTGEEATERGAPVEAAVCVPTAADTQRVKTVFPPSTIGVPHLAWGPGWFEDFQGTLFFAANFEDGRRALWKSDGTSGGTTEVKSFPVTEGTMTPEVARLTAASSQLFFQAADAAHGQELWVSDGTAAGTRFVKDLTPGPEGSYLPHRAVVGNSLVFIREIDDDASSTTRYELWVSDGTAAGTVRVRDFGADVEVGSASVDAGGALRFFVFERGGGAWLWRSDGTSAGTVAVKRLTSSPDAFVSGLRTSGALSLFLLTEDSGLRELWKTDGTAAGTLRLASFGASRAIDVLGALGGSAYVTTTSYATQYMVLYRVPLAGGNPTSFVTLPNDYVAQGEAFPFIEDVSQAPGGSKLFFEVTIGSSGPGPRDRQLWVTDGTAAGTQLLRRPLSLSDEYGSPVYAVSDDLVLFTAFDFGGAGIEPWVSDGRPDGTRRLKDIVAGASSSYPREFFRVGSRVYFSAYDDTQAVQTWSVALGDTCVAPPRAR